MVKPIKLGIVGIGRAGWGMHCDELKGKEDLFQIVAACDVIKERCDKMEQRYGCRVYENIENLIEDKEVELVSIATRSCDHFKHTVMALKAGKSVFLEKPMCETYEEAMELKELVEKLNGPRLFIRHNRRFESVFNQIKDIIKSNILGKVYEIYITRNGYSRRDDWQTIKEFGGGQLLNWGPHIIDHSLQFLNYEVSEIIGDLKHIVAAGDCEDHLTIILKDSKNLTVQMQISGAIALPTPEYRVYGSKGSLEIRNNKIHLRYINPNQVLKELVANPHTPGASFGATGTFSNAENLQWIEETLNPKPEDLSVIWKHLYESFREDKPFPISLDESIDVMKVISKVKEGTIFK